MRKSTAIAALDNMTKITPDPERHAIYAPLFARYKALADALGALYE